MSTPTFILQQLRKEAPDVYSLAEDYYSLISVLNSLSLTKREIQLVAFTAIRGNISYANIREDFCRKHSTSSPTINNMISHLKKLHVLVKEVGKIKVNPVILIPFDNDIKMEINIVHTKKI